MKRRNDLSKDYLTVDEAAEAIGVSIPTVNRMLASGALRRIKAGWSTLLDRHDVEEMKKQRASRSK